MEAKVAKTLMEAYASVYDQPEQINELSVSPDYDGPPMKREDVDVFDIVKGYLMTEHDLTEDQAIKVMLELEDEHRDAILEAYVVTKADKMGNTKAYQNYKAGMKNKLTGKPLYVAAPHLKGV